MLAWAQRHLEGTRPGRIMVNYQTKMSDADGRWQDYDLFIDPGAYSLFAPSPAGQERFDYPNSTESYINDIGRMRPELYAWRDYVCETDVREFHDVTVEKQQARTTEAHIECANIHEDRDISAEPVAVVQGYEPEDYVRHAQELVDHGLVTDTVGIGTMCGRDDPELCLEIVNAVRSVLPDANIHAFGLDRNAYTKPILSEISSTDSLAYCYQYKRPSNWTRWEWVLLKYLTHRAAWDRAIGGAEFQRTPDDNQARLTGGAFN